MQLLKKPRLLNHWKVWGERWDLNPRPSVPQKDLLCPTYLESTTYIRCDPWYSG